MMLGTASPGAADAGSNLYDKGRQTLYI